MEVRQKQVLLLDVRWGAVNGMLCGETTTLALTLSLAWLSAQ